MPANNIDGAKEAIINGKNGYILPVNTPKRMAERINYLLGNPKVRQQMGENAREMVQKFSLEKMLKDLDNLYSQLKR
ncbi:MAG: glycosyltransferase [Nanobdellota archaeon]